jgi:hypothetical protein
MTANLGEIVSYFDRNCANLLDYAKSASGTTAYTVETEILSRVIAIGNAAMAAYLASEGLRGRSSTASDPADDHHRELKFNSIRPGMYYSVFGTIEYRRDYFSGDGHGYYPLDARLNIPPEGSSDLLRKMREELSLHMSYEGSVAFVAKYFPVATSTRALQTAILKDSEDSAAYYDQAPAPPPSAQATVCAVQADCAGIPMVNRPVVSAEPCRDKGSKRHDGRMKMATAVSISTHVPFVRTAEQVVESLFDKIDEKAKPMADKEGLAFKRSYATLAGKQSALTQAQKYVGQIDTTFITDFIALTDGERALQNLVDDMFPGYRRVLDLRHAIGYLYKAADAQFGSEKGKKKDRLAWVRASALLMLRGETASVIAEVETWSHQTKKPAKFKPLDTVVNYFKRNLAAMRYDVYLAAGWPVATGLIEGCCGHVIKGRCDGAGRRWTEDGAEAMLHLACIEENADWETYHEFRMRRRHERHYKWDQRPIETPESNVYHFRSKEPLAEAI